MTAAELRAIIGAMTGGTWQVVDDAEDGEVVHAETGKHICRVSKHPVADNTRAIVALANHAGALVELVRACDVLVNGGAHDVTDSVASYAKDLAAMGAALDKVHAVGKERA